MVTLDHRQMAVVMRGQAGPGGVGPLIGAEDIGSGGHPETDLFAIRVAPAGCGPQEITLGQDADDFAVVGHHDRARVGLLHGSGRSGQGRIGGARHRRGGHEIAHNGFHGSHYDAPSLRL